ncbi:MAG: hypothetical protein ACYSYV_11290 [Planctomycetota bacterium]|jgi:hypothetical protein
MASTKDKKLAVARQLLALKELNDELDEVRHNAQAGREYLWTVFADAYIWYQKAQGVIDMNGQSYLEQTFLSYTPKITSKAGVSEFNRLAKLAFNMNLNRFAPTVSRYTAAFDYIDRPFEVLAFTLSKGTTDRPIFKRSTGRPSNLDTGMGRLRDERGIQRLGCCRKEQEKSLSHSKAPAPTHRRWQDEQETFLDTFPWRE